MKTINIKKKRISDSPKNVSLGNGKRLQFTSKRTAEKFIADTNRYLTKTLIILNMAYADIFREYRILWLVGANTNSGNTTNYGEIEKKIRDHLHTADFLFDKFNHTSYGSGDPFFAFIDLSKAAFFLKEAAQEITIVHRKKNNTAALYNCQILSDRCESVMNKLNNYDYES